MLGKGGGDVVGGGCVLCEQTCKRAQACKNVVEKDKKRKQGRESHVKRESDGDSCHPSLHRRGGRVRKKS